MKDILRQFAVIFTSVFALVANGAANAIPLNGRMTGEISDSFNVLFVPAGYVFSIWGVIYIGLIAYTIYHSLPAKRADLKMRRTGWLVAVSSIANGAWIFFWHYGLLAYIPTILIMLVLLAVLVMIYLRLEIGRAAFSSAEKWAVRMPFSIYLGWITVATIANLTAVLSYWKWDAWVISPLVWTVVLLIAGVLIGAVMAYTRSDLAYLLVLVWAFAGISVRWINQPVLNIAGFVAAAAVLIIFAASRIRKTPQLAYSK